MGSSFRDITHPVNIVKEEKLLSRLLRGEIKDYTFEKRYVRKDGKPVFVLITCSLAQRNGRVNRTSIIEYVFEQKLDEAELRSREEGYRLTAYITDYTVWEYNLVTGVFWWNEAYARLFVGQQPDASSSLDWWAIRIHPDDRDRVISRFKWASFGQRNASPSTINFVEGTVPTPMCSTG